MTATNYNNYCGEQKLTKSGPDRDGFDSKYATVNPNDLKKKINDAFLSLSENSKSEKSDTDTGAHVQPEKEVRHPVDRVRI